MAGSAESPQGVSPRLFQVLARRTVVAVAAILILSVPFAVFAAMSGQGTASSFAVLGGATALMNLIYGGRADRVSECRAVDRADSGRDRVRGGPGGRRGVVIAAIVASVSGSEAALVAIGLVLLVITAVIMLGPHSYVLYSIFITPTVVLFTSASIADVPATDAQRLGFTLIAAALILLASAITLGWSRTSRPTACQPRLNRNLTPGPHRPPQARLAHGDMTREGAKNHHRLCHRIAGSGHHRQPGRRAAA